jgi:hypothetical protein
MVLGFFTEAPLMRTPAIAILLLVSGPLGPAANRNTWAGFVTDTHCGTHCQRTSAMTPDRACVQRCVKAGSKFGLWYKDNVYVLEPQSEAAKFAAENVLVTGNLSEGTIHIKSIARIPSHAALDPGR